MEFAALLKIIVWPFKQHNYILIVVNPLNADGTYMHARAPFTSADGT